MIQLVSTLLVIGVLVGVGLAATFIETPRCAATVPTASGGIRG